MTNWGIFKKILLLFIGWRIALIILTFYSVSILPTQNRNINNGYYKPSSVNYWGHWAYWDSAHLLSVTQSGYILNRTPFFPLYPILIYVISFSGLNYFWSGFLIAQVASVLALFFLYKLVTLDFREEVAKKTVLLLLIFPTSFYLGALYSESLFLALSIAAFYFARKKNWLLASALAGFSAITRLIGVAVIISIFAEYFFTKVPKFQISYLHNTLVKRLLIYLILVKLIFDLAVKLKFLDNSLILGIISTLSFYLSFLLGTLFVGLLLFYLLNFLDFRKFLSINTFQLFLSVVPIGIFCIYLYIQFNNPVAFFSGHENWGRHFTLPLNTIASHVRMILPNPLVNGFQNQLQLEFVSFLVLFTFFCIGLNKLRFSYLVYFALSILIPISSGKLMSMPRIALVIFPMFMVIALIKNQNFQYFWFFLSTTMLAILTVLYFNAFWVA